jgi:DNA (cytosine-5)-methyltransferase 1
VFCGGTPCQAFSVAGLRNSLDDARGNLSLVFCEIANAIDKVRSVQQSNPCIIFWENVPGVLSTKDNAFGCFLGALAGEDDALIPPGGRWTNAGFIDGPKRAVAWRVLDAQYFGVAQRRRRVFVVASARDDFDPAAVLFEFDGVRRDTAPSRETGKDITPSTGAGVKSRSWPAEIANTLDTTMDKYMGLDNQHVNAGCPLFVPVQPIPLDMRNAGRDPEKHDEMNRQGVGVGEPGDPAHTVTSAFVHAVAQPIAYRVHGEHSTAMTGSGVARVADPVDITRCLDSSGGYATNQGGNIVAQPIIGGVDYENNAHGPDDVTGPLLKGSPTGGGRPLPAIAYEVAMAFRENTRSEVQFYGQAGEITGALTSGGGKPGQGYPAALVNMAVRRLTPVECERLQGFPDNYTNIPWRKKDESPDGPRYKALGNSWAVPNVRWIGERIAKAA